MWVGARESFLSDSDNGHHMVYAHICRFHFVGYGYDDLLHLLHNSKQREEDDGSNYPSPYLLPYDLGDDGYPLGGWSAEGGLVSGDNYGDGHHFWFHGRPCDVVDYFALVWNLGDDSCCSFLSVLPNVAGDGVPVVAQS